VRTWARTTETRVQILARPTATFLPATCRSLPDSPSKHEGESRAISVRRRRCRSLIRHRRQDRPFHRSGNNVEILVAIAGARFSKAQKIQTTQSDSEVANGSFVTPQRVFDQLAVRKKLWLIQWTADDHQSPCRASDCLLLIVYPMRLNRCRWPPHSTDRGSA